MVLITLSRGAFLLYLCTWSWQSFFQYLTFLFMWLCVCMWWGYIDCYRFLTLLRLYQWPCGNSHLSSYSYSTSCHGVLSCMITDKNNVETNDYISITFYITNHRKYSIELPYYLLSTVTSVPNIYKCDSMTDDEFQANKDFLWTAFSINYKNVNRKGLNRYL